ncbi:MAG: mechanosensitive ion channel [Planctomycetota bacterium]
MQARERFAVFTLARRVGLLVVVLAACLLGAPWAHAEEAWETEPLEAAKLEARRGAAEGERAAAAAAAATDPQAAARADVLAREVELLDRLLAALAAEKSAPTQAVSERRRDVASQALADLPPASTRPPVVLHEDQLRPYIEQRDSARTTWDAARDARAKVETFLKRLTSSASEESAARLEELRTLLATPPAEGATDAERAAFRLAGLEQRVLQEERRVAEQRPRFEAQLAALTGEERLAEAKHQRAVDAFTGAQEALERALSQDEARAREAWDEAIAARDAATDPLERFVLGVEAERQGLRVASLRAQRTATEVATWVEREERRSKRIATEQTVLEQRFASPATGSTRTGELFRTTLRRLRLSRERLARTELPAIDDRLQWVQQRRAEVQERLYEVEPTLLEDNSAWLELEAALGDVDDEQRDRAQIVLRKQLFGADGLVGALNAHVNDLEALQADLATVESKAFGRRDALDDVIALVMRHIYWVRTDDPVSWSTVTGAGGDLQRIGTWLSRPATLAPLTDSLGAAPLRWVLAGLLALALVLAWVLMPRWKGHVSAAWVLRGGPWRRGLVHGVATLVAASVVPLLLLGLVAVLEGLDPLPDVLRPLLAGLKLLAGIEMVRRLARRVLEPGGVAQEHLGLAADLAQQVGRSIGLAALAASTLLLPWRLLKTPPFDSLPIQAVNLPRILYTLFLLALAWAIGRLLPRSGPLVKRFVRRSRFAYALWGVLGPVLLLVLFGIAGMDALGYRIGASFLLENVGQTVVAVLLLGLLYVFLQRLVHRMTGRVLARATEEGGQHEARKVSAAVFEQLTRVVSVAVLAVAVVLLARFWNLDVLVRNVLGSASIVTHDDGSALTLWHVLVAALWVAGAHFLVRNLGAILTFLKLAVVGEEEGSGMYVLAALLRYAVLLIGYSAALLTLGFSFSSIGWLLAAASVGIGFGLQEIVANFVSGLILLLERPVRVGDTISVGDSWGTIRQISARATIVENRDRQIVIVPNKELITNYVTNWTRNDRHIRWTLPVGVAYGSDVALVLKILDEVAKATPGVARKPAPEIYFTGFGESSLDFELWYFAPLPEGRRARSAMHAAIDARFREENITIPFPQRDLHVISMPDRDDEPQEGV